MPWVLLWWGALSSVAILNVGVWLRLGRHLPPAHPEDRALQRLLHGLAGVFVLGCAFRSFFPRADVQRIVLFDGFVSSVLVGRTVATLAELAFVTQWAVVLGVFSRARGHRFGAAVAWAIPPMIVWAECWSWYATATTNYLGNVVEESTWAAAVVLLGAALIGLARRTRGLVAQAIGAMVVVCAGYVTFMGRVDVPMYYRRWRADETIHRTYLGWRDGLHDVATRWVLTHDWIEWREEVAWMSLYFGAAVWISLLLSRLRVGWLRGRTPDPEMNGAPPRRR